MVFSLSIIHNHVRMSSSITRVLHTWTTTWRYFSELLGDRFIRSPKVVKEAIMTDINDLVQKFWTSSNGAVGSSFFATRLSRLHGILQRCFTVMVCFDIISFLATAVDLELIT